MRTEEVRYLLEIVKCGSIHKAADTINISPQGLGKIVRHLEAELGSRLLDRSTSGVALTETGSLVVPYLQSILESEAALLKIIDSQKKDHEKKILCTDTELGETIRSLIEEFNKTGSEQYKTELTPLDDNMTEDAFRNGNYMYRITCSDFCEDNTNFRFYKLMDMYHYPVVSKDSDLLKKKKLSISDLSGRTVLIEGDKFTYVQILKAHLAQKRVQVRWKTPSDKLYLFQRLETQPDSIFFAYKKDIELLEGRGRIARLDDQFAIHVEIGIQSKVADPDMELISYLEEALGNI